MKIKGSAIPLVFDFKDINDAGTELTFEHIVKAGTINGTVQITKATCFDANNLKLISDVNGNGLALSSAADTDTKFIVDTVKPNKLTVSITASKNPTKVNDIDTYIVSPSLSITGNEAGSKVEYSLDNGVSWNVYSTAVSIPNGSYKITARQTDKAGNVSELTDPKSIVVDSAFPSIVDFTVSSPDGNYKVGSKVQFALSFSNKVIVASGNTSKVTFESVNTPTATKTANVVATDAAGQNTVIFEYTVQAGDNLQGIVLKSVSFNGFTDTKGTASGTVNKTDKTETRAGIILDGVAPTLTIAAPAMTGDETNISGLNNTTSGISTETDNSKFKITLTFAEDVYKETGNIILQRTSGWAIPAVMNSDEFLSVYNKVKALDKKNGTTTAQTLMRTDANGKEILHTRTGIASGPYRKITHGLKYDADNGTYVPDEDTKYVLAYELGLYEGTANLSDGKLVTSYKTALSTFNVDVNEIRKVLESVDYHRHTIDVAGGSVKILKNDGETEVDYSKGEGGRIVQITFAEAIEDGREWELIIPPTAFRDNAENFYKGMNLNKLKAAETTNITTAQQNASDKYSVWSNNVAQPVVRVDRYTHGWGAVEPAADGKLTTITVNNGKFTTATADNSSAVIRPTGYARVRIDCETPGAKIKYSKIYANGTVYTTTVPAGVSYNNTTTGSGITSKTEGGEHTSRRNIITDISATNLNKRGATDYTNGSQIIIGDGTYTTARKDYITAYATKDDFNDSVNGYEGIFKTIVYLTGSNGTYNINVEGGTAPGGSPSVSGFPLRDATSEKKPYDAGRYSKNCYCIDGKKDSQVFVSYEIISDEWAVLLCKSNHAKDYPFNTYGGSAYVSQMNYW